MTKSLPWLEGRRSTLRVRFKDTALPRRGDFEGSMAWKPNRVPRAKRPGKSQKTYWTIVVSY